MVRLLIGGLIVALAGCRGDLALSRINSPAADGLNTRDIVDAAAQKQSDELLDTRELFTVAERIKTLAKFVKPSKTPKNILCLSGGGSYGAYSAGVLCGWTCRGDRPEFDVVTGISTGALIAPFAFLGPEYDAQMKAFYTTVTTRDLYRTTPIRGLFRESFTDTAGLAAKVEASLTPEFVSKIAAEHAKGRRLYVGTTELDGKRFVVWDIGAIAARGTPEDAALIRQVLLGSSAIPGFFPPARIDITVDGKPYTERHVDGGVSTALFFRPPYVPEEKRKIKSELSLGGDNVYCIVAGKLYADPSVLKPRSLTIAGNSVSSVIYAQTRDDLLRIWTLCTLSGMNYHMASIPEDRTIPKSSAEFVPAEMVEMFNEGARQVAAGTAWRKTPPGVGPGESSLMRRGTALTHSVRGGPTGPVTPEGDGVIPKSDGGIPAVPGPMK